MRSICPRYRTSTTCYFCSRLAWIDVGASLTKRWSAGFASELAVACAGETSAILVHAWDFPDQAVLRPCCWLVLVLILDHRSTELNLIYVRGVQLGPEGNWACQYNINYLWKKIWLSVLQIVCTHKKTTSYMIDFSFFVNSFLVWVSNYVKEIFLYNRLTHWI